MDVISLPLLYPNSLHTTKASTELNELEQIGPQTPFEQASSRPSFNNVPLTRRIEPSSQPTGSV